MHGHVSLGFLNRWPNRKPDILFPGRVNWFHARQHFQHTRWSIQRIFIDLHCDSVDPAESLSAIITHYAQSYCPGKPLRLSHTAGVMVNLKPRRFPGELCIPLGDGGLTESLIIDSKAVALRSTWGDYRLEDTIRSGDTNLYCWLPTRIEALGGLMEDIVWECIWGTEGEKEQPRRQRSVL